MTEQKNKTIEIEEMELNKKAFQDKLIKHKKIIVHISNILRSENVLTKEDMNSLFLEEEKDIENQKLKQLKKKEDLQQKLNEIFFLIRTCRNQAKELSLVSAKFKCEKCGSIERLSWHHLVKRKAKDYMEFHRYFSSRYYWNNIIILCWKHHKEYHDIVDKGKNEHETEINKNYIKKLIKKYYEPKKETTNEGA